MSNLPCVKGKRVLVVEDEFFVAMDLEAELEDRGAAVTCASTLRQATDCAARECFDGVILDLNLHGEESFPLADLLRQSKVPFLFHTGHGKASALDERYPGVVVCNKPCDTPSIISELGRVMGSA